MGLLEIFKSSHDDVPLEKRDVIPVKKGDVVDKIWGQSAVNFNHIVETGEVPQYSKLALALTDHKIDWKANDSFSRAMDTIEKQTDQRIKSSPELQNLLKKDHWSKQDREVWEERVSNIVSQETAKIPG